MPIKTPIKVISLENSEKRRAEFSRCASDAGIDWSFFSALSTIAHPLNYMEEKAVRRCGRGLTQSEIGCYTSHFKCWEWLARSGHAQAIFFEDDILVDWNIIRILASHNMAELGIKLLRLYAINPVRWKMARKRLISSHCHLVRNASMALGLQGYLLTRDAARILVSRYADISAPVDRIVARYWEHDIVNYSVFPYPVIEKHVPSTIGHERDKPYDQSLLDRSIYLGWRIRDKLTREYTEKCIFRSRFLRQKDAFDTPLLS